MVQKMKKLYLCYFMTVSLCERLFKYKILPFIHHVVPKRACHDGMGFSAEVEAVSAEERTICTAILSKMWQQIKFHMYFSQAMILKC